jgi:hypothetical protein
MWMPSAEVALAPDINALLLVKKGIHGLNVHFILAEYLPSVQCLALLCATFWLDSQQREETAESGLNLTEQWLRMLKFQVRRIHLCDRESPGRMQRAILQKMRDAANEEDQRGVLCARFGCGRNSLDYSYRTLKDAEAPFVVNAGQSPFAYSFSSRSP